MLSRAVIRENYRNKRLELTANELQIAASKLKQQLLQNYDVINAQLIAAYLAYNNEIDPLPWLQKIYHTKSCYLPIINPSLKQMMFAKFTSDSPLKMNQYGILEPAADNQVLIAPQDLDIVLLPLVAFDMQGNRIGMGAGYYDKTFAFLNQKNVLRKPKLIGLAYEFQKVNKIQAEPWDVPLDGVITEQNVYTFCK